MTTIALCIRAGELKKAEHLAKKKKECCIIDWKASYLKVFDCLFCGFNIPVNNFSVMSGHSHCFLGITQFYGELMCLADYNLALKGFESFNSKSR